MSDLSEIAEGLNILSEYGTGDCRAEHDELFAGSSGGNDLDAADLRRLDELGFTWDEDDDCWKRNCS